MERVYKVIIAIVLWLELASLIIWLVYLARHFLSAAGNGIWDPLVKLGELIGDALVRVMEGQN